MRTDSPIAVRCLFDTLAVGAPWISLTELAGATNQWPVRDAAGQHYAAELGVTWLDDTHWTATVPRDQRARATPRLAPSRRAETHANL